jgi:hypothetical protein
MRLLNAARHWFWVAPAILGIVFIGGGIYMMMEGGNAKDDVRDAIVRENITTSEDASIPNERVDDADTAQAQAEVIEKHVLETTGGKTYAELERDDPDRATVLNSVSLRTALNLAVMGFKISDLVIGMGAFMVVLGITHIVFLAPAVYWAAEVANQYSAGRKGGGGTIG